MQAKGNFQITGDLKARNFPQDVADFYGITVKQVRNGQDVKGYRGLNTISFGNDFYLEQNTPNIDEVLVNFRGGSSAGVSDHGALTGLGDDDHLQYALADRTRPTTWNVTLTDGSNPTYTDDVINLNPTDFYLTSNSTGEPVVNLQGKSAAMFFLTANQTTDLTAGDHIKFNGTSFNMGGSISLDSTSAYTSASGASLGRITLQPGRVYEITSSFRPGFTLATDSCSAQITNDSGVSNPLGSRYVAVPASSASNTYNQLTATVIVAPVVATRYEVRLLTAVNLISIDGSSTIPGSFIKVIEL